ncbi:MAG TPA: TIGR02757 family protein [Puia sp.]|jgi:uncharacterized protein (TIGR02757 family)|nr:TIGR02757 family protein [Puia sp.]
MAIFPNKKALRDFLEKKVVEYNHPTFITNDPISVPHRFSKKQDIEIAGFFTSIFSWGNRTTIIRKSSELLVAMDNAPYQFIKNHRSTDLKPFLNFKHRTFNATDLLYFFQFLQYHYRQSDSLETAFLPGISIQKENEKLLFRKSGEGRMSMGSVSKKSDLPGQKDFVKNSLTDFYHRFFSLENVPHRTQKHIASPEKNSACKRLNMYLRWMVRTDKNGVDFGIWKNISAADLICPLDLHVARVARKFGLISRKQSDWETAMELTRALRSMDKNDPVKFDFALFGLGVAEKY